MTENEAKYYAGMAGVKPPKQNWDGVFKVNDKVLAFGCEGVVIDRDNDTVVVSFAVNKHRRIIFYPDGRYYDWAKEPSLKFVSREEKSVTITRSSIVGAWNTYSGKSYTATSSLPPLLEHLLTGLGLGDGE